MPSFGGLVATLAALSWAIVYACTQEILSNMSPLNLLTSTYLLSGILSLAPFAVYGSMSGVSLGISKNPFQFSFYVVMILIAKFFMIYSVKLIGATAAGLVEISYVRCFSTILKQGVKLTV
jgi:hypothetical protein